MMKLSLNNLTYFHLEGPINKKNYKNHVGLILVLLDYQRQLIVGIMN